MTARSTQRFTAEGLLTSSSRSFLKHRQAALFLKPSPSYVLVWFGLSFIVDLNSFCLLWKIVNRRKIRGFFPPLPPRPIRWVNSRAAASLLVSASNDRICRPRRDRVWSEKYPQMILNLWLLFTKKKNTSSGTNKLAHTTRGLGSVVKMCAFTRRSGESPYEGYTYGSEAAKSWLVKIVEVGGAKVCPKTMMVSSRSSSLFMMTSA